MSGENNISYRSDIFEIIKNSKKYSKDCFTFTSYTIIYSIDGRKYEIEVDIYSNKFSFKYRSHYDVNKIEVNLPKKDITERKVLNAFGKMLKHIDKLNYILNKQIDISKKIQNLLILYFKNEYSVDIDFQEKNVIEFRFPSSYKKTKRRSKSTYFDVITENPDNINYTISATIIKDNVTYRLSFNYHNNRLKLERKDEVYQSFTKDVSKIIRSEKLRKLETF